MSENRCSLHLNEPITAVANSVISHMNPYFRKYGSLYRIAQTWRVQKLYLPVATEILSSHWQDFALA